MGDDGFLYVSVGIDVEIGVDQETQSGGRHGAEEGIPGLGEDTVELGVPDERSGTVIRFRPDGSELEIYATGFKNPLGIAFDGEGNLFATDNGPANPDGPDGPDELNHVIQAADYGYPNRPGEQNGPGTVAVAAELQINSSSNGLTFYYRDQFPEEYRGNAFIAQWGADSGDPTVGKQVVRVSLEPIGGRLRGTEQVFATGFEHPLDTILSPDGSLFVADWGSLDPEIQRSGAIYRIFYRGE